MKDQPISDDSAEHQSTANHNLQGVFLHVLADTLGSVAVIISAIFIEWFGFYAADPICCFVISFLILISVLPLLKQTMNFLVLGQDGNVSRKVQDLLTKEKFAGYNLEVENVHVWELSEGSYVCSIKALITAELNPISMAKTTTNRNQMTSTEITSPDKTTTASSTTSLKSQKYSLKTGSETSTSFTISVTEAVTQRLLQQVKQLNAKHLTCQIREENPVRSKKMDDFSY